MRAERTNYSSTGKDPALGSVRQAFRRLDRRRGSERERAAAAGATKDLAGADAREASSSTPAKGAVR